MWTRIGGCLSVSLLVSASLFAATTSATEDVQLSKAVQIPESLLQPGTYKVHLEDRLPDRAIVRIIEPNGADHYLLTVPAKKAEGMGKGLTFFSGTGGNTVLHEWRCASCELPLEFVYPKDEAVKLTAETGKPILAYDPSYDKLPSNLSPEDRKIVTLWLLAPKVVTPAGTGEGLTASKYSSPKLTASSNSLPKKMPKTASSAFLEMITGLSAIAVALTLFLIRRFYVLA